jgi:L-fuconolactonase
LALQHSDDEAVIAPDLPIIDAHHHLWRGNLALAHYALDYMAPDLLADAEGHNVVATVYMEAHAGYRTDGPEALRPVGETEFAVAAGGSREGVDLCAGIVGFADLMLGEAVGEVLDAHVAAGAGRFRGVRNMLTNGEALGLSTMFDRAAPGRLLDPTLAVGARQLAQRGLTFDTWIFQHQLGDLCAFADAVPELTIVLDHMGGYACEGRYEGRADEARAAWAKALADVAQRPNVVLKLGGFGMSLMSPDFVAADQKPSSEQMADAWRPLFDTGVALFGVERCMFESNFPVDRPAGSYRRFWNAFKRLAAGASADETAALFSGTAARVYRIPAASHRGPRG